MKAGPKLRAAGPLPPGTPGSLYKAPLGAGGMPSPGGPSLASVCRGIYCFSRRVCSHPLPRGGLLYPCFTGKVRSTHKWLNNTTVQALLLLLL